MRTKLCLISLLLFLLAEPLPSWAQLSISAQWKARAIEASETIVTLQAKLKKLPRESKEASLLGCKYMLEFAYVSQLTAEEITHKRETNAEVFHLVLNGGDAGIFDLAYVYTKEGKHTMTRVDHLPKDWHIFLFPDHPVQFGLSSDDLCTFIFNMSNPFESASEVNPNHRPSQ
ncbi:MAG: hypothetical protein H8K03_20140 [Nitrospira sp.]